MCKLAAVCPGIPMLDLDLPPERLEQLTDECSRPDPAEVCAASISQVLSHWETLAFDV